MKKFSFLLPLILFVTVACSVKYRNMQSFETVWRTVTARHYDPTFGGVGWKAAHDRYQPQIAAADSEADFYRLTNRMLFELNRSHLLVATREDLETYVPVLIAKGTVGIDIKWINGKALVTTVEPGGPADRAGLRPGCAIVGINGKTVEEIVSNENLFLMPPFNDRNRRNNLSNYLLGQVYGRPHTTLSITYRDAAGVNQQRLIWRESRGPAVDLSPVMPPAIIEFESKRLAGGIACIRFNHFAAPVDIKFIAAAAAMHDTHGMIIDLRGTPGGYFSVLDTIAEQLLLKKMLLYHYKFRERTIDKVLTPAA
jgi:C-terminal processing protease CtpA/Prc